MLLQLFLIVLNSAFFSLQFPHRVVVFDHFENLVIRRLVGELSVHYDDQERMNQGLVVVERAFSLSESGVLEIKHLDILVLVYLELLVVAIVEENAILFQNIHKLHEFKELLDVVVGVGSVGGSVFVQCRHLLLQSLFLDIHDDSQILVADLLREVFLIQPLLCLFWEFDDDCPFIHNVVIDKREHPLVFLVLNIQLIQLAEEGHFWDVITQGELPENVRVLLTVLSNVSHRTALESTVETL